jgi:hypothetical protein
VTKETIKCPNCSEVFELSEAISHDIEIRLKEKYENEMGKLRNLLKKKQKRCSGVSKPQDL